MRLRILRTTKTIYIYGPHGTGKTHLLMATAHALKARGLNALYVKSETFTEHLVKAIRAGEMHTFRSLYRDSDVLLVDDIHHFSRKWATQEEFFHTFNTLHLAGKQIILSSAFAPQELTFMEPRLISRFEWGIVMPLQPLQQEELLHVLRYKAVAMGFSLPPRVEEFLCETFSTGPAALCHALEALALRCHLERNSSLTVRKAQELLHDLISDAAKQELKPEQILQTVAQTYGIRVDDITGRVQTRECVVPRQMAMYFCRQNLRMPLTRIGALFGRDHSTVMASIRQIQKSLDNPESDLRAEYGSILRKLRS